MSTASLPKSYTPGSVEPEITAKWHASRAFHADPSAPGEPYAILIPPPNVTAALHLGHALNNTLQDVLVRAHRMGLGNRKYNVMWMPGTDHAGIATQAVVEKRLQLEGTKRTDFTREEFIALVQKWKDEYEATITEQLKSMGCSCDFERQRFTMDPVCAKAVREAFFRLFKDGLIYRGKRLVNWDPVSQTALADDEVEMEEIDGQFYYLRYPLVHPSTNPRDPLDCQEVTWSELAARGYPGAEQFDDDDKAWVTVATTRPETYLGDTAVAVNPKDPRATALRGLCVQLPLVGRVIPIIEDDYVVMPDPESSDAKAKYATGFLKVTPAHDPNDWEIGQRHKLPVINVMAPDASISDKHGWPPEDVRDARMFVGKSREQARKLVVKEFERRGLLEAVKPYRHAVGHSYRSHVPIEPYLSDQWYVAVTDDRLVGEAQRALNDEQFEGRKPARSATTRSALTSRDREGATSIGRASTRPPLNECAFFVSFTAYGNWLHGDDRGSVDRWHNIIGEPTLVGDEDLERREYEALKQPPMEFDESHRIAIQDAIVEVCAHREWRLIALHVRTKHVHAVVVADTTPERVMNDFKAYATRKLRERRLVDEHRRVWTRHGSTRYLNDEAALAGAARYVIEEQGAAMSPLPIDHRSAIDTSLPHGRGSLRTVRPDAYDGALTFFPPRYAKMYQGWHEGLRDWCISRQLWWGHRIPVWAYPVVTYDKQVSGPMFENRSGSGTEHIASKLKQWEAEGRIAYHETRHPHTDQQGIAWDEFSDRRFEIVIRDENDSEVLKYLEENGFRQDPDVLDTWFSSGLWPLSTMGWPTPGSFPDEIPEGEALLNTFNPTAVLLTAREIITLWVSRMVMFNRYFNDGKVPFRHVYIHAMIQDGHGQKMSKSLGNGVDPRDIIHSHGADAMRFTLVDMATGTQDVRMPVDIVCPHCGEVFHPKEITTSSGYRVAAPQLDCIKCSKPMVSAYGAATGEAKPSAEAPLARNTSSKFDLGRNFANKLWNAARFALSNLAVPADDASAQQMLVDKWIINRLHKTLHTVEDAISNYEFAAYAEAMYDFIWRDFCDWYLEAIKPTVKTNAAQQQVLRTVLNAALRLLHPIMPFVTEALWPSVQAAGTAGLPGIKLPPSDLLATATWPDIACKVHDKHADALFERVQALVNAIRNVRGEHKVQPKQRLGLLASPAAVALIEQSQGVVEALAGLESVATKSNGVAGGAVAFVFEGEEALLTGVAASLDVEAERSRLTKLIQDREKAVASMRARLANESYIAKAPPHLVEETRTKLAEAEADLAQARSALQSL